MFHSIAECGGVKYAFVAALPHEIGGLAKRWSRGTLTISGAERTIYFSARHRAVLVCAGTGRERAYQASRAVAETFSPQVLVSIGFAGSCVPELAPGTVMIPARLVDAATGKEFECAFGSGTLASLNEVAGVAGKRQARERCGALAVEMEAAGVAAAAAERGTQVAAIKAISDGADEEMDFLAVFVTPEGFATGRFLAHVVLRPRLWPRVAALQRNSKLASAALERAVAACCIKHEEFVSQHSMIGKL